MASDDRLGPTTITSPTTQSSPKATSLNLRTPEICVICLERISDKATSLPCRHDHFHFSCLGTWLQEQRTCPLCKGHVRAVRYDDTSRGVQTYQLPADETRLPTRRFDRTRSSQRQRISRSHHSQCNSIENEDPLIAFRRQVYRDNLYSLHVGSNRHSGYRPAGSITPDLFKRQPEHLSRARAFIRRELQVFDFLEPTSSLLPPDSENGASTTSHLITQPRRRVTNREYLLEYIVSILQAIPLKGSEGQAEELLAEYLGRVNARLFLHELESWLRSPFERLSDWDRAVQDKDRLGYGKVKVGEG